ncbi:MAG: hypothetical protein ACOWWO_18100 [Peptococcaceae bacterium]
MKTIERRVRFWAMLFCSALASWVILLVSCFAPWEQGTLIVSLLLLSCSFIFAVLMWKAYQGLKIARLILENQLLCIRPAVVMKSEGDARSYTQKGGLAVYVSYFGILLGSRIIKFNQDGIRLRAVEIGPDSLLLTYGDGKKTESIRLLRAFLNQNEMKEITEKFRYETGVTPLITD